MSLTLLLSSFLDNDLVDILDENGRIDRHGVDRLEVVQQELNDKTFVARSSTTTADLCKIICIIVIAQANDGYIRVLFCACMDGSQENEKWSVNNDVVDISAEFIQNSLRRPIKNRSEKENGCRAPITRKPSKFDKDEDNHMPPRPPPFSNYKSRHPLVRDK
jgi:hypothetical protein